MVKNKEEIMLYITSIADLVSMKESSAKLKITEKDAVALIEDNNSGNMAMPLNALSYLLTQVHPQKVEIVAKNDPAALISLGTIIAKFDKVVVIGNPVELPEGTKGITRISAKKPAPKKKTESSPKAKSQGTEKKERSADKTDSADIEKPVKRDVTETVKTPVSPNKSKSPGKPKTLEKSKAKEKCGSILKSFGINPESLGINAKEEEASVEQDISDIIKKSKTFSEFRQKILDKFGDKAALILLKADTDIKALKNLI